MMLASSAVQASTITTAPLDDPLHGYCSGTGQCIDNGTNSPTTNNPPTNFGFTVSPGPAPGDLLIDILVPNNEITNPSLTSYALTGTLTGTATLVSTTAWTSGDLDQYLGISASPNNPIGAYLPSTQDSRLDPGATGFYVFQVDLGNTTLQDASNPNSTPLESLGSQTLPLASYITAFLNEGGKTGWVATANSGAIFEESPGTGVKSTGTPFDTVPEPTSMVLLGTGVAAAATRVRRKHAKKEDQSL
jgi:hypothetical protein